MTQTVQITESIGRRDARTSLRQATPQPVQRRRVQNVVYFTQSLATCWNHRNIHFLRGVLGELGQLGCDVGVFEPEAVWGLRSLLEDTADGPDMGSQAWPEPVSTPYCDPYFAAEACSDADLVIVHAGNHPALITELGRRRREGGRFILLFHDTYRRAIDDPGEIEVIDLDGYDGVLAVGEELAELYRFCGWSGRVFVWREAADLRLFRPSEVLAHRSGVAWIGDWGDGSPELQEFLLEPALAAGLSLEVRGLRCPEAASIGSNGACFHGWLPNAGIPEVYGRRQMTVHAPLWSCQEELTASPSIRVFEALACGIPLICAPWRDGERLFREGEDFLLVRSGEEMADAMRALAASPELGAYLAANGLQTIRARHTCAHRARELLEIADRIVAVPQPVPAGETLRSFGAGPG
jgi:spore maturation protein CgeB